jgi:Tol biopolymer transport system component
VTDASAADVESIWQKLRRRRVVQWGLAYAAGAWGVLQGFEYVSEAFGWPNQLRQVAIFTVLIGLPIVLLIAWYHGERGKQRVTVTEVVMVALLAAAGVLFSVAATSAWLLVRTGPLGRMPLADARFSKLTDFDGVERSAAISRDGKFAAFLSDRDGTLDAWVSQIGTGEFHNLTHGEAREFLNDEIRNVRFSPDGSLVTLWSRTPGPTPDAKSIDIWAVPTMGGSLRKFLASAAELDWSSDGTRLVHHPSAPGDPLFVTEPGEQVGRQIYVAAMGTHCHFPTWSPDDAFIYFVRGEPPDVMDIWRVRPDGTDAERMTFHESRVSHPAFLDRRTVLYLATVADGSGPWLHVLDVRRRESRRLVMGAERYTSLAASADGQRLLATVARSTSNLWRVPISDGVADGSAAARIDVPTTGGHSPRFGPGYLLYVSSKREQDGIWKLVGETATELWSMPQMRIVGGPAISPDGQRVAFTAERDGRARLHVITADGASTRILAESLEAHGTPAWSPDGQSIAVAASSGGDPRIYAVPLDGRSPVPMVEGFSTDPSWSPRGDVIAYAGPQVGVTFEVRAVTSDGKPRHIPKVTLTRGARRISFWPDGGALVVLLGETGDRDLSLVDLETGSERRLTSFGREIAVGDFDVAPDGREIVFDRRADSSDILLIDRGAEQETRADLSVRVRSAGRSASASRARSGAPSRPSPGS